jgi:hypothetical protein
MVIDDLLVHTYLPYYGAGPLVVHQGGYAANRPSSQHTLVNPLKYLGTYLDT